MNSKNECEKRLPKFKKQKKRNWMSKQMVRTAKNRKAKAKDKNDRKKQRIIERCTERKETRSNIMVSIKIYKMGSDIKNKTSQPKEL